MIPFPLINLWEKRSLVLHFSVIDLKLRYKGTTLGLIWAILEPLLIFSLLYIVFTTIRQNREDFAIYLIIGILLHHLFARGSLIGLSSLTINKAILQSIKITKEFFPVVATGTVCLLIFVEVGVLFGLMPFFNFIPSWTIILIPLLVILFIILILGISYILSIIHVFFRDVQPIWGVFVYSLLFISPIFWYVDQADGILLQIHQINPLGQLIELGHKIVVFGETGSLNEWLYSTFLVLLILFIGFGIFQKFEKNVSENL